MLFYRPRYPRRRRDEVCWQTRTRKTQQLPYTQKSSIPLLRKSKFLMNIFDQVKQEQGVYSLNHLKELDDSEVMRQLLTLKGIGPKTASCIMSLCMEREVFVVDVHIHRIVGGLGWRPLKATPEQTRAHLEARIPTEFKYSLHLLFIDHGRNCSECKAGGKELGECEIRKLYGGK